MKNLLTVLGYVPRIRRYITVIIGLNLISAVLSALQPYAFKLIIDTIVEAAGKREVQFAVFALPLLLLLGVRIANSLIGSVVSYVGTDIFHRIMVDLRHGIFTKLTTLSTDFFERERAGTLIQRYTSSNEVARWTESSIGSLIPWVLTVLVSSTIIIFLNPLAGGITLAAIIIFFAFQIPVLRRLRPLQERSHKHIETASAYFTETVQNIATVRSFGGEQQATLRESEEMRKFKDVRMERQRRLQISIVLRQITFSLAIVGCMAVIAAGVLTGRHTAGDILLVALYLQQIQGSLWPIGRMIIDTNEADVTAGRIVDMLGVKATVTDAPDAIELDRIESVEFRNVSFAYPGKRRKAIENVSFKIEPGQTLALVGPSGTGKTTITKLLLRFYNPSSGQILVNGEPVECFTAESVRQHMGVVMQDVALFNDTIEANLQLAAPDSKRADVREAASKAHANIFIENLPDKYKTLVGERGVKLSGGEKQRVAVARAILKSPDMIILDEATSALDSESERHVQAGLTELMSGRTSIVIAHRLSTIMAADTIVVMDGGKVVETGNHDRLVKKRGGLYAKLFSMQTRGFLKG